MNEQTEGTIGEELEANGKLIEALYAYIEAIGEKPVVGAYRMSHKRGKLVGWEDGWVEEGACIEILVPLKPRKLDGIPRTAA